MKLLIAIIRMKNQRKPTKYHNEGFIPPQAIEIERAVLGALLIEKESFNRISEILKDKVFYSEANQTVYDSIKSLNYNHRPIDMLTVVEELKGNGKLEEVGGAAYIAELTGNVASSAHLVYHANIIRQKFIERETANKAHEIISRIHLNEDIGDIIFQSGKELEQLQEKLLGNTKGSHISDPVKQSLENMNMRINYARNGERIGIDTGLSDLNRLTYGWQNSNLYILAARPAMGKTAKALQFAKKAAMCGTPVTVFSMEMSAVSLSDRLIISECDIDPDRYKSGFLSNEDITMIDRVSYNLSKLPIYIDDEPNATMSYIRAKSRVLKKQGKCGLIIADYLQLAEPDEKTGSREQDVARMSKQAKQISRELDVPFLLLAQLNRGVESRTGIDGKRPQLSDLRESGAIEQDADMVIFIYRPEYYGFEIEDNNRIIRNYGELIIAKHRHGPTGWVKFLHNDSMTRFYDYKSDNLPF